MNDNEKTNNAHQEIRDIIESFAPSYNVIISQNFAVRDQILSSMLIYWSIISASWIYIVINQNALVGINFATVAIFLSIAGLWRVNCLERVFGIWKWDYRQIGSPRLKFPYAWRFDPAANA
jgi:hypothetical protein